MKSGYEQECRYMLSETIFREFWVCTCKIYEFLEYWLLNCWELKNLIWDYFLEFWKYTFWNLSILRISFCHFRHMGIYWAVESLVFVTSDIWVYIDHLAVESLKSHPKLYSGNVETTHSGNFVYLLINFLSLSTYAYIDCLTVEDLKISSKIVLWESWNYTFWEFCQILRINFYHFRHMGILTT